MKSMNRLHLSILAAVLLVVAGVFTHRVVRPAEPQPDFRQSVLDSSEEEVRARFGEPILCVDQRDGRRALAFPAVRVGGEVKPVVVYLAEDRVVSVTSRGTELGN